MLCRILRVTIEWADVSLLLQHWEACAWQRNKMRIEAKVEVEGMISALEIPRMVRFMGFFSG